MPVYTTHTAGRAGVWGKYPFVLPALGTFLYLNKVCADIKKIIKDALSRNTDLSPRQLTSDFQYNYSEYSLRFQMLRTLLDAKYKEGIGGNYLNRYLHGLQ